MEKKDDDLIIDGNSVYEIDRNCEAKLKSLNNRRKGINPNSDLLSLFVLILMLDL